MTGREFYTWMAGPCTIRIALTVVERLNRCLSDSRLEAGEEQGGILYGTVRDGVPEIANFEFFRSEHRRGISYDLGARERARMGRIVAARMRDRNEKPLGYFRTHLRPGMFLDQDDFALMEEAFARPDAVALLIRPSAEGLPTGGFFFWEDGDIDRRQTRRSFPFDAAALLPEATVKPEPVRAARRVWPLPAPSLKWGAAALVVPALAAMAVYHRAKPEAALVAQPYQPAPAIVVAPPVTEAETRAQYAPPVQPIQEVANSGIPNSEIPKPEVAKPEIAMHEAPPPVYQREERAPEAHLVQVPQAAQVAPPRPVEIARETPPPPVATPATIPPPVREDPRRERTVLVAVSMEPRMMKTGKSSEIRKAVGHVPLLGHPFRPKDEAFIPAKPERTLAPRVPGRMAEDLLREFPVDVRLSIDSSGAVTTAEVLNGGGTSFANLAAETAGASAWHPAVLGDRQVPSEMILHYRFRPVP